MQDLKADLKEQIVVHLNLEEVDPKEIKDDEPLFGDGLGLDSIDALELIVMLEAQYGLKVTNPEDGKRVFHSVNSLADYINENKS
jgi:acyl carrier protein